MDLFKSNGIDAAAIVVGNEPDQQEFTEALGLTHIEVENKPLAKKFSAAFEAATNEAKEYVCWLGSNNVHDFEYFKKCMSMPDDLIYFGSNYFHISCMDIPEVKTFVARKTNLCSSGQFYRTDNLRGLTEFYEGRSRNFDGIINARMISKYGRKVSSVASDSTCEFNCVDFKTGEDMHSFANYRLPFSNTISRTDLEENFEEIRMYINGDFSEENYRTAVLEAYLSEKERT